MPLHFPTKISLTITNRCNLRCRMCGQWSDEGYMRRQGGQRQELTLSDWQHVIDQLHAHQVPSVLIRGGEPFLYPDIMPVIRSLHAKNMFVSIDTNGTLVSPFAAELVQLGRIHLTFSIDGTRDVHDEVRGTGSFEKTKNAIATIIEEEQKQQKTIGKSLTFTISRYNYHVLGSLPDVARQLGLQTVCIVPYYYVPSETGKRYQTELMTHFNCPTFSWKGFHHEQSGINISVFKEQYRRFLNNLGTLENYPYMPLDLTQYETWFTDAETPVEATACANIEHLIDIQPNGDLNFCVDFPDYTFGNVKNTPIDVLWQSEAAEQFRQYRRNRPFAVCHRCGAKHMGDQS